MLKIKSKISKIPKCPIGLNEKICDIWIFIIIIVIVWIGTKRLSCIQELINIVLQKL